MSCKVACLIRPSRIEGSVIIVLTYEKNTKLTNIGAEQIVILEQEMGEFLAHDDNKKKQAKLEKEEAKTQKTMDKVKVPIHGN